MPNTKDLKDTSGFYDKDFNYAQNGIFFPDGTSIVREKKLKYKYPVKGWTWFDSIEDAYASQGKTPPVDNKEQSRIPHIS